jgi:hypothetical protein
MPNASQIVSCGRKDRHEEANNCFVVISCTSRRNIRRIFISVFNQLDAQTLFHSKFYFMPLHVSSTCAHHQKVKIALHNLRYHHTYMWPSREQVEIYIKKLKTLLHVSIIRSSSGSILCSSLKLQFKTLSVLLRYINLLAPELFF